MPRGGARLAPAVFPASGRGLAALEPLGPGDPIVVVPTSLLILPQRDVLPDVPHQAAMRAQAQGDLYEQMLLAMYLANERHRHAVCRSSPPQDEDEDEDEVNKVNKINSIMAIDMTSGPSALAATDGEDALYCRDINAGCAFFDSELDSQMRQNPAFDGVPDDVACAIPRQVAALQRETYYHTVPESFTVAALFPKALAGVLPHNVKRRVGEQMETIKSQFAALGTLAAARMVCTDEKHYGKPGSEDCVDCGARFHITWDTFVWAWFAVNSRCITLNTKNRTPGERTKIALAPFLDLLNHTKDADVDAYTDHETNCFTIVTNDHYARGDQVFINYGAHDNDFLVVEYGFTLSDVETHYNISTPVRSTLLEGETPELFEISLELLTQMGIDINNCTLYFGDNIEDMATLLFAITRTRLLVTLNRDISSTEVQMKCWMELENAAHETMVLKYIKDLVDAEEQLIKSNIDTINQIKTNPETGSDNDTIYEIDMALKLNVNNQKIIKQAQGYLLPV